VMVFLLKGKRGEQAAHAWVGLRFQRIFNQFGLSQIIFLRAGV
jgi:hypothetical protein